MCTCNVLHVKDIPAKKQGLAVPSFILLIVHFTQEDKKQDSFTLYSQVSSACCSIALQALMVISLISRCKGTNEFVLKHGPRPLSALASRPDSQLPAPSNITLCICAPYTLARGVRHPTSQSFAKGKPPRCQSELG